MILDALRLILFAALLLGGLFFTVTAVLGANRFRFSLNRLHAAGMGDTLGLLLLALAAAVYAGFTVVTLKIFFLVAFFWLTSPVCGHLIGRLVRETEEKRLEVEAKEWKP